MVVLDDCVCDDREEGEDDGAEEPDVDDLEVRGFREVVTGLGEKGGKDEQGCEGHHNPVLEVKPLEEESGEGDDVDESRWDENGDHLRDEGNRVTENLFEASLLRL